MNNICSPMLKYLFGFCSVFLLFTSMSFAEDPIKQPVEPSNYGIGLVAIVAVLIVVIGAVWYMYDLQKRYYEGAVKNKNLKQFFESPAGLPQGTVRSIMALMIVSISLFFITLQFFFTKNQSVPEGLMTLLSAVVAFYFANRAGSQGLADTVARQTQEIRDELDSTRKEKDKSDTSSAIGKLKKAAGVIEAGISFLPEEKRKQYENILSKVKGGLDTADKLIGKDNVAGAKELVDEVLDEFKKNNPVFNTVKNALPALQEVLKGSVPALGLLIALTTVGVKIGSARYERWKRRVLQAPITVAMLSPQTFDGITAKIIFENTPLLHAAFKEEIKNGTLTTLENAANDFVAKEKAELASTYEKRFDSEADFEQAVQLFRQSIVDQELKPFVEEIGVGQAQTFETLMSSIDKIHEDETARAHLDEFLVVIDGLMREGEPVLQIMNRVEDKIKENDNASA